MTRDEAHKAAAELQAEHPDRASHRFVARADPDGSWSVAKVLLPEQLRSRPLQIVAEPRPHRPFADDARPGHERRVPGLPGGLG